MPLAAQKIFLAFVLSFLIIGCKAFILANAWELSEHLPEVPAQLFGMNV